LFFHGTRLAVPDGSGLREICFAHAHSSAYAGHPGYLKILKLLERTYYLTLLLPQNDFFGSEMGQRVSILPKDSIHRQKTGCFSHYPSSLRRGLASAWT
jgi:hypothetical protein